MLGQPAGSSSPVTPAAVAAALGDCGLANGTSISTYVGSFLV